MNYSVLSRSIKLAYSYQNEYKSTVCAPNTGNEQVDEQTAQEETEDKLKQCIDNLMDKRWGFFLIQSLYNE